MIVGIQRLLIGENNEEDLSFEFAVDYDDPSKVVLVADNGGDLPRDLMSDGVALTEVDLGLSDMLSEETGVKIPRDRPTLVFKPEDGALFLHALYVKFARNNGYSVVRISVD